MQSTDERQRSRNGFTDGPSRPLVAVLKCAAAIAILFVVAAGPWIVLGSDGFGSTTEARQKTPTAVPGSVAESRRVFEERRQRFEGARENTKAALAK